MKARTPANRIVVGMLPAMALLATPALAQIVTQTTPPPVPSAPAPAPEAVAAPAPSGANPSRYQASLDAATGQTAAEAPAAAPARAARPARTAAPRATLARRAPVVAAPVETAGPPVAALPPEGQPVAAPAEAAPVTTAETTTTDTAATPAATTNETSPLLWILGALAALGAIALVAFALRRRNRSDAWEETYVEQEAPLATAPAVFAADHAEVVAPDGDDVAAITEASAPVAGRPWIELSLRPVRAGSDEDEASVDLELTLANAGEETARDVRVATFMLGDAATASTDMERLLTQGHPGASVEAGSIAAGEGARIDAHLAMPRGAMAGATFQPVVVADVRYTLPNGSEGRTAAAFTVGVADDTDTPTPFRLGGDVREDVAAALHGVPERA